jgi:hypothetical protein
MRLLNQHQHDDDQLSHFVAWPVLFCCMASTCRVVTFASRDKSLSFTTGHMARLARPTTNGPSIPSSECRATLRRRLLFVMELGHF